jgi:hypothetical protein
VLSATGPRADNANAPAICQYQADRDLSGARSTTIAQRGATELDGSTLPPWTQRWLSLPRLTPYVRAAGAGGALNLYRWNCQLSTALFELIGWFEIAWRNAIDTAITDRRPGAPHWLLDPGFPLRQATRAKVTRAVQAVRRNGTTNPLPGQVIAELSLGFWRFPTMRGYTTTVWAPYLSRAFPHAPHRPQRDDVDSRLQPIILLRNRIAHHEPVFADPAILRDRAADILELGAWINPHAATWWARHTAVLPLLSRVV